MSTTPEDARVLATDLDGTLLRPDGSVGQQTRSALQEAEARGVRIALVTGRPARWMGSVVAATGASGLAICANGAAVIDLESEHIVATRTLPDAVVADTIAVVRGLLGADAVFAVEQARVGPIAASGLHHQPGFLTPGARNTGRRTQDLGDVGDVAKLLVRTEGDPHQTAAVAADVTAALQGTVTVTHASRTQQLLEISAVGVDKAATLAQLVAEWGLASADVVAAGDMPNDIPMLRWAGYSCAVESSHPAVLPEVDEIIGDPVADGMAALLSRLGTRWA